MPADNDILDDRKSRSSSRTTHTGSSATYESFPRGHQHNPHHAILGPPPQNQHFGRKEFIPQNRYPPGVNGHASGSASQSLTPPQSHSAGSAYARSHDHHVPQHSLAGSPELNRNGGSSRISTAGADESWIPPSTTTSRPPTPSQSEALGGYRDMTAVLTPAGQHLVFGNMSQNTTPKITNSPLPGSWPIADRALNPKPTPSAFTVGISPDEINSSRRKLKAKSTARQRGITTPSSPPVHHDNADSEAIDLTKYELEFGTTRLPEAEDTTIPSLSDKKVAGNPTGHPISTSALGRRESGGSDTFEVRDFGYGFGPMSGSGHAPAAVREDMLAREKQRELERQWQRDHQQDPESQLEGGVEVETDDRERDLDLERRDRGPTQGSQDRPYFPHRGRGSGQNLRRGFSSRHFSRGYQAHFRPQSNFAGAPQNSYQPSPPHGYSPELPNAGYYLPSPDYPHYGVGYDVPYSTYTPIPVAPPPGPAPGPISALPFALDPTRYYLLGQLEYYLSPQNMAQDFYLRQQVSSILLARPSSHSIQLVCASDESTGLDLNSSFIFIQSCATINHRCATGSRSSDVLVDG